MIQDCRLESSTRETDFIMINFTLITGASDQRTECRSTTKVVGITNLENVC